MDTEGAIESARINRGFVLRGLNLEKIQGLQGGSELSVFMFITAVCVLFLIKLRLVIIKGH